MILIKDQKNTNSASALADNLDTAIKELEKHFSSDTNFPTLEEQLKIGSKYVCKIQLHKKVLCY